MKPTDEEIARRNENCMSERLFNRILRNFLMCTVLSVFAYRGFYDGPLTLLSALACYAITTFVFYVALLVGQIPFVLFNDSLSYKDSRAPAFYSKRNTFGRIMIGILALAVSFFAFYFVHFWRTLK